MSSEFEGSNSSYVSDGSDSSVVVALSQNINNDSNSGFEHDDRNDIDADSTRSSSPFLSNPELSYKEKFSPVASSFDDEEDISRRVQDMDTSIASLRETLGDLNVGDKDKNNQSIIVDESFHNSTMDTTRYNETQAQFDRDLDFDQNSNDGKTESPRHKKAISPWKQLRSTSTAAPGHMGEIPKLHFNQSNFFNNDTKQSLTHDTTAVAKINELNKQVTGYRIQIKLFKQFLQHLIDKTRYSNTDNVFDISELNHFQNNLNGLSPSRSTGIRSGSINTNAEIEDNLSQNYDELLKLNEDLYLNLEDFQNQLHDKEVQLNNANVYMNDCSRIINEILELLINDPSTDDPSRQALVKCLDGAASDAKLSKSLETKLYVVRLELRKKMERKDHSYPSPPPSNPEKEQIELSGYITIIQGLIASLDKVQKEFLAHKQDTSKIQEDLKKEVESTQTIRANYESLYNKFNQLCASLERSRSDDADSEMQKLRIENQKLRTINNTVDNKFNEYQKVIDKLQSEVNDLQKHYSNSSIGETSEWLKSSNDGFHHNDLLLSHKEVNQLQEQLNNLTERYRKLQDDSSNTISTLTNQLNNKKQESLSLGANQRITDQLKNDLELAVEKQRVLKAEKIRLSYSLESLAKDKVSLQTTIRSLTEKITSLTVEAPHYKKDEMNEGLKKLNVLEYQLSELLSRDVHEFQKFLKSFIKIADDSSLKEPKRKIDTLAKKISQERNSDRTDEMTSWDISELNTIREYHKSVFDYFARAVDIIVNDHVKLLLKEGENTSQTNEYVNKLHKRIDELNNVNDNLTRQLDSYYTDDSHNDTTQNTSITSTGSKMRITELTNRWKAEREARVYENQEAKKRLKELDRENARLRQELDQVS
ncbi:DEHA2F09746p [Debaryomyces hansenii CBS767]|uniref:DEHA2F09746p n=1 Tax=Debaryomyces hansenii (strain ATCC 36239 / CBS 767 / BCRC 21394 / JCM 1990 / NBRC 0083 / IGC 2968) TaxID=284592 RepID=Q6BLY6_DEBHA|nr:DEHA2F09746p [Debaryomyces hansenii CBS767]CAG89126.2 DEHA2F09746p [Debaryomyces hansenii CBS767]|eukprot:XP_460785.2 DEHA2F09746p [Debaryomyces hansenii CBS767]